MSSSLGSINKQKVRQSVLRHTSNYVNSKNADNRVAEVAKRLFALTYRIGKLEGVIEERNVAGRGESTRSFSSSYGISTDQMRSELNLISDELGNINVIASSVRILKDQVNDLYLKHGKISYLIDKLEEVEKSRFVLNVNGIQKRDCLFQNANSKSKEFELIVDEYTVKDVLLDQWDNHLNNWCSITESLQEDYIKFQNQYNRNMNLFCHSEIKFKFSMQSDFLLLITRMACKKERDLKVLKELCQKEVEKFFPLSEEAAQNFCSLAHAFLCSLPLSFCRGVLERNALFPESLGSSAEELESALDIEVYAGLQRELLEEYDEDKNIGLLEKLSLLSKQRGLQRSQAGLVLREGLNECLAALKEDAKKMQVVIAEARAFFKEMIEGEKVLIEVPQPLAVPVELSDDEKQDSGLEEIVEEVKIEVSQPLALSVELDDDVNHDAGVEGIVKSQEVIIEVLEPLPLPVVTKIEVKCQLPEGRSLRIYGEGGGLDWVDGKALEKVDEGTYVYCMQDLSGPVQYKLRLDGTYWERDKGNHGIEAGASQVIAPSFLAPVIVHCGGVPEGDQVFIRGSGPGMDWKKGIPLRRVGNAFFLDTYASYGDFEFKVLLNDDEKHWCKHPANYWVGAGQTFEIGADFY